ncbi:serine protease ami-like [Choristoneura fumiferana]|uniref:serine protease ami-like n=1 Tax=Choristoneura fumiferana TaxID=7141 RepID=UPI003D154197
MSNYIKMLLKIAVTLSCFVCIWGLNNIGDPCEAEGDRVGTCMSIYNCSFAYKQVQNHIKPKTCRYMGKTRIVCCPNGNPVWDVGQLRAFFGATQQGMLQGRDMTCRYNGEMPALCCGKTKDVEPPPEPRQCPPLPTVTTKADDIAFKKCLEYRRYASPCVADKLQEDKLDRDVKACHIDHFGDRISGGTFAKPYEFPHMALLGCRNDVDTAIPPLQWVAGGSLISDKFILTAAHVLSHHDYGPIRYALLGANNKTDARNGFLFNIVNVIAHKLYDKVNNQHDIALLELHRRVTLSEFVRPACLPTPGLEMTDSTRILAGWGGTSNAKSTEALMKAYIAELDYETYCKKQFPDNVQKVFLKDSMLCAGTVNNDTADSCQGDSGGPLMALAHNVHCTYIVHGVVSFGTTSCGLALPGIYTNVKAYLPWIVENVWRK